MQEESEVTIMRNLIKFVLFFSLIAFSASLALASTPVSCSLDANNPNLIDCNIPENVVLQLPFLAIAGDVVVQDANSNVSDVFRIFNNVFDTGAGTGLGDKAILVSADHHDLLGEHPPSANAVALQEAASGSTSYVSDGIKYILDTSAVASNNRGLHK